MNFNLTEPKVGDRVSASLVREIVRAIRSLTPIAGHGMKVSHGPNGTVYDAKKENQTPSHTVLPWTFSCTVGEDSDGEETRTGGWYNGQVQVGLKFKFGDFGIDTNKISTGVGSITECDQTEDGRYFLEAKLSHGSDGTFELKRYAVDGNSDPVNDFANDTYYIYIGKVEDAKQTDGIYCVPVIYKYL